MNKSFNAVYDLAVSPPTFDFVGFLVSAERARLESGKERLRIIIVSGPDNGFRRDHLPPRDPAERRRMLENIVIPMCSLLPSVNAVEQLQAEHVGAVDFPKGWSAQSRIQHYGTNKMAQAWKAGFFPFRVPDVEVKQNLVTITLREAPYWPTRNSNVQAWHELATLLRDHGYEVRIIGGDDLQNSYERAQVYAGAKLNLFVSNGPVAMASFMPQASCLVFKMCSPGAPCVDPGFFSGAGFPVGSQIGRKGYRIVWKDDDLETISSETLSTLEYVEKEAA